MVISSRKWRRRTYNNNHESQQTTFQNTIPKMQPQKTTRNTKTQSNKTKEPTIRHPSLRCRGRIHRNHQRPSPRRHLPRIIPFNVPRRAIPQVHSFPERVIA